MVVILYNDEAIEQRQRWTIAHEIGHIFLQHNKKTSNELEANTFAQQLLAPAPIVMSILNKKNISVNDVGAGYIKNLCDISMSAAQSTLDFLQRSTPHYLHRDAELEKEFSEFIERY